MSSPFLSVSVTGQPRWVLIQTVNGKFSILDVTGLVSIPEVGYGQEGYGIGGYDTPGTKGAGSSQPVWTVETLK